MNLNLSISKPLVMAIKHGYVVIFLLSCRFLPLLHLAADVEDDKLFGFAAEDDSVRRSSFPEDFVFGSASSAYQVNKYLVTNYH